MKRTPRYDNHIRSELTKYVNFVYEKLWVERGCPANIVIGESNMECFGNLRELRYGHPGSQVCDNLHLRGKLGEAHWTNAVVKVFKLAFPFLQSQSPPIIVRKPVQKPTYAQVSTPPMGQRKVSRQEERPFIRRPYSHRNQSTFSSSDQAYNPSQSRPLNPWQPSALPLHNRFNSLRGLREQ